MFEIIKFCICQNTIEGHIITINNIKNLRKNSQIMNSFHLNLIISFFKNLNFIFTSNLYKKIITI
jgi:hypothetical protein